MSAQLEIKLVVNEVDHPRLFAALVAQLNPRRRAALLRRLADDGCRPIGPAIVPTEQFETPAPEVTFKASTPALTPKRVRSMSPDTRPDSILPSRATDPAPSPSLRGTTPTVIENDDSPPEPNIGPLDSDAAEQIFAAWG